MTKGADKKKAFRQYMTDCFNGENEIIERTEPLKVNLGLLSHYESIIDIKDGIVIMMGGRANGKTQHAARWVVNRLLTMSNAKGLLMRLNYGDAKKGLFRQVASMVLGLQKHGLLSHLEVGLESIANRDGKFDAVGIMGLASNLKSKNAGMRGLEGYNFAIIEEVQEINEERDIKAINDISITLRADNSVIMMLCNPPHKDHWLIKDYFSLKASEYEDFYHATPSRSQKENIYYYIHNIDSNTFLPDNHRVKVQLNNYGDINHPTYNIHKYCTDTLGLVGGFRSGRVYTNWQVISDYEFDSLPYQSHYGMDFGFTMGYTTLIEIKKHNEDIYIKELLYERELHNIHIANKIKSLIPDYRRIIVYADSAEPKSIAEIRHEGIDIREAQTAKKSIGFGIQYIYRHNVYYTQSSKNLEYEMQEWSYRDARKKEFDFNVSPDHALDGVRYALEEFLASASADNLVYAYEKKYYEDTTLF